MHLPVGPDRHRGPGQGTAPASTGSGCAAASRPRTGRPTPPPAWPPSTRPGLGRPRAGLAAAGAVRHPPRAHGRVRAGEPAPGGRAGGGGGGRPRRPPAPAGRRGRGLGEPRRRPDLDAPADDQPTAAVGAVAFAPGDPAVAYAGTGQGEALAALGVGLLRSGDGGATWRALVARELLGAGFHDLLVDPGDAGRLLAATTAGLWASADGGRSWERRGWPAGAGRWSPGRAASCSPAASSGCTGPRTAGPTWRRVPLASAPAGFDRVAVAHAPGGQVAYVFAAGDGVGHLWRREHAGGPFEPVKPPADLHSRQAWHALGVRGRPRRPGGRLAGRRRPAPGRPRPRRPLVVGRPDGPAGRGQPPARASTPWCSSPATPGPCTWPTRAGCSARPTAGAPGGRSASAWPWPRSTAWPTTGPGCWPAPASSGPSATRAARCGARSGRATRRWWPAASWSRPGPAGWSSPPTAGRPGPPSPCPGSGGR